MSSGGPARSPSPEQLTQLLQQAASSADADRSALFAAAYGELRRLARHHLGNERKDHTLQPTALVHEAFLRLAGSELPLDLGDRAQFFAAAATAMRRILVDHARGKGRDKRGGGRRRLPLDGLELATQADPDTVIAIDLAIAELEGLDQRLAQLARLRLFAGLDEAEISDVIGVSDRTVRRDWLLARAFLQRHLGSVG